MDPINNNNNYTASPGQTVPPQPETVQPEPQPEKAPTFRGGLILGLCIGLVLAIGVGVFGYMQVRSYTALMGDAIDRPTMGKILAIEKVIGDHFYDYEERNLSVDDMREGLFFE